MAGQSPNLEAPAAIELVAPARPHLASYVQALQRGWSSNTVRPVFDEELAAITADPDGFVVGLDDLDGRLPAIQMSDGTTRPRLPGFTRWMWDGEFCGSINFRWIPGSVELPPYVLGHIGYSVVPWKRGRGVATAGLSLMLVEVRPFGLPWVELTTNVENLASRRVIEANGGIFVERFEQDPEDGGASVYRYRISLGP